MPETQSQEKKDAIRFAGATLLEVPAAPYKNPNNYVHVARRLSEAIPGAFLANQWDNLANRQAHIEGTGPEIWHQMGGKVDAISCAMGTGGTLTGVAEYLRGVHPEVKIGLTDPCGAVLYRWYRDGEKVGEGSSISEGIGQGRVTGNMEASPWIATLTLTLAPNPNPGGTWEGFTPDLLHEIPDEEWLPVCYDLLQEEGLCIGGSAAVNVAGAMRVARDLGPGKTVVTVLCDSGMRYAGKLFNREFLESKGLPVPAFLQDQDVREREKLKELLGSVMEESP